MQLDLNEKNQELKHHGDYEFPVNISQEILSRYERGSFSWHWHTEIELTLVLEGCIAYRVHDKEYELHAGDGIFCNANALHTGHMIDGQDCYYISTTFHPRMIYGFDGSDLQLNYVNPILKNASLGSVVFRSEKSEPWETDILSCLRRIYTLYLTPEKGYEMQIQQLLSSIWLSLFKHIELSTETTALSGAKRDNDRLREILTFIQSNYMEKITLHDIAACINICKSECCRFFKRHMNESLFDYLLNYRIEKSLLLLAEKSLSITEISENCGFATPGYYSRVFRQVIGSSPSAYRKEQR